MTNKYDGEIKFNGWYNKFEFILDRYEEIEFIEKFFEFYDDDFVLYITRPDKYGDKVNDILNSLKELFIMLNDIIIKYHNELKLLDLSLLTLENDKLDNLFVEFIDVVCKIFKIKLYDEESDIYGFIQYWCNTNIDGKMEMNIFEAEKFIKEKLGLDVIITGY